MMIFSKDKEWKQHRKEKKLTLANQFKKGYSSEKQY